MYVLYGTYWQGCTGKRTRRLKKNGTRHQVPSTSHVPGTAVGVSEGVSHKKSHGQVQMQRITMLHSFAAGARAAEEM